MIQSNKKKNLTYNEVYVCMNDRMLCSEGKQSPCLLSCLITWSSFTTVLLKVNMSWVYYHYNVYSYQTGSPWYPTGIEHHPLGNKSCWSSLWGSVSINILTWSLSSCFFKMISTDLFTVLSPKCSLKRTRLLVTSSLIVNLISMGPSRSLADRIPRLPSKQETN